MFGPMPGPNKAPSFWPQRDYSLSVQANNGQKDLIPGQALAFIGDVVKFTAWHAYESFTTCRSILSWLDIAPPTGRAVLHVQLQEHIAGRLRICERCCSKPS
jgi:hypothetical protein